ncbi:uncharacterized protein MKZ38_009532 [Zalerion maritima]|uniref:ubiquitinyl hydrolase 1 n=1 Tax=Zalerion maritima TaxID=339359 RepID=A0AAD5RGS9_9PEZI|nr:uncharacterized protein MKZ38_009532 [Zalerion maritima]
MKGGSDAWSKSGQALEYLTQHVFLPPKLPGSSDSTPENDQALLDLTITTLVGFQAAVHSSHRGTVTAVQTSISQLRDIFTSDGSLSNDKLEETLQGLVVREGMLPLYIEKQNAGILISNSQRLVTVEALELAPLNSAVIGTIGRLQRSFPGPAVRMTAAKFSNPELLETVADTLATMSFQSAPGTQPQAQNAGKMQDEAQNTTNPRVVTELFLQGFLSPMSEPVGMPRLLKNTREEVIRDSVLLPWHRSPLWLFLRVVLQLHFSRAGAAHLYKAFMVCLMGRILDCAVSHKVESDILHVMQAKISRRVLKFKDMMGGDMTEELEAVLKPVQAAVHKAHQVSERRWRDIMELEERRAAPLLALPMLDFKADTLHSLPRLSTYIENGDDRRSQIAGRAFHPQVQLSKYTYRYLPRISGIKSSGEYCLYNLRAFETWVENKLHLWIDLELEDSDTCGNLSTLIECYFSHARAVYECDPEGYSVMVLTVLELWVAMDKSAIHHTKLLNRYDPGIPANLLEFLLLPSKSQMQRAHAVKKYIDSRKNKAVFEPEYLFAIFGSEDSFGARYFSQSEELKSLFTDISNDASEEKARKLEELSSLQAKFRDLTRRISALSHEYTRGREVNGWWRGPEHMSNCGKCRLEDKAENLSISVHEWPLPSNECEAQAVVFELQIPSHFARWRDSTMYLQLKILGHEYWSENSPSHRTLLSEYSNLQPYMAHQESPLQIILVSDTKSMSKTHYRNTELATVEDHQVSVRNGMCWDYFDQQKGCFGGAPLMTTDEIPKMCTYTLPSASEKMQKYIFSSVFPDNNATENTVIAKQSECPLHFSLEEYKSLASLRLGTRLWWDNILRQLAVPTVDFKKVETTLFILQALYQHGPFVENSEVGEAHEVAADERFAREALQRLREAAARVSGSWECCEVIGTFVAIATRLLCLAASRCVRDECAEFLSWARAKTLEWATNLKSEAQSKVSDKLRTEFVARSVEIALVGADTFHVPNGSLEEIFNSDGGKGAEMFLRCSIIIQEGNYTVWENPDFRVRQRHRRWKWLSYRAYPMLSEIVAVNSRPLENAILASWKEYSPSAGGWAAVSDSADYWLVSQIRTSFSVHLNLLTGELLANGLPLSRLPSEYESHPTYRTLFGSSALDVMPSCSDNGYEFSGKGKFAGHVVHFSMHRQAPQTQGDMLVQASKGGQTWELIPQWVFNGSFPTAFVDQCVHWHNVTEKWIEFRPLGNPWMSSSQNWRLERQVGASEWYLSRGQERLVSIGSSTAKEISAILCPLATPAALHTKYHSVLSCLEIELPLIQLRFDLEAGSTSISSREFPSMVVDGTQALETLVGVEQKLVLKSSTKDDKRLVVVLDGHVTHSRNGGHVRVQINRSSARTVHPFAVDKTLRTLKDNHTLKSKLFICYLHALSSHCLPDPFTGRTGTEQALSILRSAAVRSFDYIDSAGPEVKILSKIARITPTRSCSTGSLKGVQKVEWDPGLSFLSQHGDFFTAVKAIVLQASRSAIFHPDTPLESKCLPDQVAELVERDNIRASTFRVSGFGAEAHTASRDAPYEPRDWGEITARVSRAHALGSVMLRPTAQTTLPVRSKFPDTLDSVLWQLLSEQDHVFSTNDCFDTQHIRYSGTLLLEYPKYLFESWLGLQKTLGQQKPRLNRYKLAMWLSALAYSEKADMSILHALASFYILPIISTVQPSVPGPFRLKNGLFSQSAVERIARSNFRSIQSSPEWKSSQMSYESDQGYFTRRERALKENRDGAVASLSCRISAQWPCARPSRPSRGDSMSIEKYIHVESFMVEVELKFKTWYDNYCLKCYSRQLGESLISLAVIPVKDPPILPRENPSFVPRVLHSFISIGDVLSGSPPSPSTRSGPPLRMLRAQDKNSLAIPRLASLVEQLQADASHRYEKNYVSDLKESLSSLQGSQDNYVLTLTEAMRNASLTTHFEKCQNNMTAWYQALSKAAMCYRDERTLGAASGETCSGTTARSSSQWPRVSPVFFLEMLSRKRWPDLPQDWKKAVVKYALSITEFQRAERLLKVHKSPVDLIPELRNKGHQNWDPFEYPETLLLEVESGITIRDVQEMIAKDMRDPEHGRNSVMQLNMGEGKSSVIVPMVAAALADGSQLVRVVVGKPQSRQMLQMLVSKLGGLLDRRVYHMPFSRALSLTAADAGEIGTMCRECMATGGVLLVQPEHILSFQLMGLECLISGGPKTAIGNSILRTQHFFDVSSRDIVDESDENFSVKFELLYTMGTQRPMEFSPDRWLCIQQILELVRRSAPEVHEQHSNSMELNSIANGCFPRTRVPKLDAQKMLIAKIADHIERTGLTGFPIGRQPKAVRRAVMKYIKKHDLTQEEIDEVERPSGDSSFWSDTTRTIVLLLRGILAGGVLGFVFGQKRWRVNYGLDLRRTGLAVPYRAKDSPAPRAEFSHPDVVIFLSCLSYYYGGLSDDDLFLALSHLQDGDQADAEYQLWVADSPDLHEMFCSLAGINLKDTIQCQEKVFPSLRYSKAVVDYYLSRIIFPKEMKEFPLKLSASGWDLGKVKGRPITGFSGTNDSRNTLPTTVHHLDLGSQKHTNAKVLEYLLQDENTVELMPPRRKAHSSEAELLIDKVIHLQPPTRVILDVGAQILELDNLAMAKAWLAKAKNAGTQAVVFLTEDHELSVLDSKGGVESFQTSPFAKQLDKCLVFLDEAHTRGINLVLPSNYRAAVTLGANLTKDVLVQACMRMRKLGQGQSVVFCVPEEIQVKIHELDDGKHKQGEKTGISVADILAWSISETLIDLRRSMSLWAVQGERFDRHSKIWAASEAKEKGTITMTSAEAGEFQDPEAQTIQDRYHPRREGTPAPELDFMKSPRTETMRKIADRCQEFEALEVSASNLQEEQERELSPEMEQEREIQRPADQQPAPPHLHPDVTAFVRTGRLNQASEAFRPAFSTFDHTTAAVHLDTSEFPGDVLATRDYARVVATQKRPNRKIDALDDYIRPVQWILTGSSRKAKDGAYKHQPPVVTAMVIISSFEASRLRPLVLASQSGVHLHNYAPRPNAAIKPIDHLELYAVPEPKGLAIPRNFIVLLNLFAGQLYLGSFREYVEVCDILGLVWKPAAADPASGATSGVPGGKAAAKIKAEEEEREEEEDGEVETAADGFILCPPHRNKSTFRSSPVQFVKVLMAEIRRNCDSIDKTHLGKILDGSFLTEEDFQRPGREREAGFGSERK